MNASANAETPMQRVIEIVEREAQKRFAKAKVERVVIDNGPDGDDENVLRIFVVLEDPRQVDPKKVVSFIGQVRAALEGEDDRFPLISYFSKDEAAELLPEAV